MHLYVFAWEWSCWLFPFFISKKGVNETQKLLENFELELEKQDLEEAIDEETEEIQESGETTTYKTNEALLEEGGVIGIIEIDAIGIKCPIVEGTSSSDIRYAIGHLSKTTGIGEEGNCVLAGHNGSRYGKFFTDLIYIDIGELIKLTDKNGNVYLYEVAETYIVDPYDYSVATQTDEKILTLLTCAQNGTMRFICKCIPVE